MASIVSIIPIVLLFILMLGFKMAGHKSALLTLVVTVLLALFAASPLGMIAPEHAEDSVCVGGGRRFGDIPIFRYVARLGVFGDDGRIVVGDDPRFCRAARLEKSGTRGARRTCRQYFRCDGNYEF